MSNFSECSSLRTKMIRRRMNVLVQLKRPITVLVSNLEAAIRPGVRKKSVENVSITDDSQGPGPERSLTIPVKNLEATMRMNLQRNNSTSVKEITEDGEGFEIKADKSESNSSKHSGNSECVSRVQRDNLKSVIIERVTLLRAEKKEGNITIRGPLTSSEKISNFFQPRKLSMGPVHAGLTNLQFFEKMKWTFLTDLTDNEIEDCIDRIGSMEKLARGCYADSIGLSSDEFVQILLIDSIFFLLIATLDALEDNGMSILQYVLEDLLKLQNQIPFFIIREVWEGLYFTSKLKNIDDTVLDLATLLHYTTMFGNSSSDSLVLDEICHLLDLYYKWKIPIPARVSNSQSPNWFLLRMPSWFLSWFSQPQTQAGDEGTILPIQSATELYNAGVKFKPKAKFINILDISFENGILEIPPLVLNAENKSVLANLLLHEMTNEVSKYVTNYVKFMNSLINTKKDIVLLEKFGVIDNKLSSDDEAADFIKSIGEAIWSLSLQEADDLYAPMIQDTMKYAASRWRRNWTSLKQTYFNNLWTSISVIAGSSLLILAFVQTYYTVYPYVYHHNN